MKHTWVACAYFLAIIMVLTLVLQNLITAVIVNNATSRRQDDDELMAAEHQDRFNSECRELREIFELADTDGDGTMSWDEFQNAVASDERFGAKLEVMGIAMHEAHDVW